MPNLPVREFSLKEETLHFTYSLGENAKLWSEHAPVLYRMHLELDTPMGKMEYDVPFGLRRIEANGRDFLLNGKKIFLRGTVENCLFPQTGHPPMEAREWLRVFSLCKQYGLNHVRFHSWCPPRAAFEAADRVGIYLQVENSTWIAGADNAIGVGNEVDHWIYDETLAVQRAFGNHPSFLLYSEGNEPICKDNYLRDRFLEKWIRNFKDSDSRHLYCAGTGWPLFEANDYHVSQEPRIQRWSLGYGSIINARPPSSDFNHDAKASMLGIQPVITHELGQWAAFPNLEDGSHYTGALRPRNLEIFKELLKNLAMEAQARDFLMASGKLQVLCYKADIEAILRTHWVSGYQLLGLNDYSGQGGATCGVLNALWELKPYCDAESFRRFANTVVPLFKTSKFILKTGEPIEGNIAVANYSGEDSKPAIVSARLYDLAGNELFSKQVSAGTLVPGNNELGDLKIETKSLAKSPAQLKLVLRVQCGRETFENDWDLWILIATRIIRQGSLPS